MLGDRRFGDVRVEIEPINSDYEHVAYQANNIFTIELKAISKEELEEVKKEKFGYTGEEAYLLLSCAPVEGRISGIVDIPNACATLAIPTEIFDKDILPV